MARMIGAPPGYIGYEEGGQLTEHLRRKPYSVVLFDEIEKAHPDVCSTALLQILEDGRLTDGQGRTVSFRNAVIVMTSNVGSSSRKETHIGFSVHTRGTKNEEARKGILDALRSTFRPEFLNRVDDILVFNALSHEDLKKIIKIQLARVVALLAERGLTLQLTPAAEELLMTEGYDPAYGARPMRRAIQRLIQDPLALQLLSGTFRAGDTVVADVDPASRTLKFEKQAELVAG